MKGRKRESNMVYQVNKKCGKKMMMMMIIIIIINDISITSF